MRQKRANPDALVARWAAKRHGVVTTEALRKAGLDDSGIRRRVSAGRLHRLHRGVFAVGHRAVSFEGTCLAGVLAAGEGAVLSHRSAGELWCFLPRTKGPVHVTVPGGGGRRRRRGLVVHRSRTLAPALNAGVQPPATRRAGIPVTTPLRTLADLRRVLDEEVHDRAVRKAIDLRLIARTDAGSDSALTRSMLEREFLAYCRRHRIPRPAVNARVERHEVDFLWERHRLVVETDGFRWHSGREAFERDRGRDAELQALGYRVLRVTHRQMRDDRAQLAGRLRAVLAEPSPPPP